jgi:hypothetical protein
MLRLTTLCCALLLAAPVIAAPADGSAAAPQPAQPPVKAKKICKQEETTGSIMPKRTCKTQEEWDAVEAANRGALEQMRQWQTNGKMVSGNR